MPAIENVTRRGAVYWWRRRMRFVAGTDAPITITVTASLQTKEQATARQRAVALTGRSEVIRMSLYEKIEQKGLSSDHAQLLFQAEVVRYRNMLAYQQTSIQMDGDGNVEARMTQMLAIYEAANSDFARQGFAGYMDFDYVAAFDERFAGLDRDARRNLLAMLSRLDDVPGNLLREASDALQRAGIADDDERRQLARRIICEARATAVRLYRNDDAQRVVATASGLAALMPKPNMPALPSSSCTAVDLNAMQPPVTKAGTVPDERHNDPPSLTADQTRFAPMTPLQAVEEYMRSKPKTGGIKGATGNVLVAQAADSAAEPVGRRKSSPKVWGDSQRRQFKAAAFLFGKSNGGRPLSAARQDDLVNLYDALNRMPSSHHKSPRHEKMTLEEICAEAEQEISAGTACSYVIGLDVGTINRHFANLKQLCGWMAFKTPMAQLDFSDFILEEDDRDDRTERDPYTIKQGLELFALPIWTGCASLDDRLQPGVEIWHDAAFWVLIIVWYTGMRREEACKLLVDDIRQEDGIWFFDIRRTRAGGVKTATSVRQTPICSELIRLGFLDFVEALRQAGEEYLFCEILPGRGGRTLGDVFYKQVWMKIRTCLTLLQPGQAVHSGRHMVSTELKMLRVFEEFRSDLLGQKTSGENGGRYASASRLNVLLGIVEQIPIVTAHLPSGPSINLLPVAQRCTRPVRETVGRRKR